MGTGKKIFFLKTIAICAPATPGNKNNSHGIIKAL
jgi:hypothetical protein